MFGHPLVPGPDIINTFQMSCKPILRIVPIDRIDLSLIREWPSACESDHRAYQLVSSAREAQKQAQLGFIFINVDRKLLVHESGASRYLALSYVWGGVRQLQLTQATRPTLEKDRSLSEYWEQTPQVIRDVINFVAEIGERYLWVDTLCIIKTARAATSRSGR